MTADTLHPHHARERFEEWLNALTHGAGAVAALAGAAVLITLASIYGDAWAIVGSAVYGTSLLALYVASTLYHAISHAPTKAKMKIFDHCMIYVLIAGTYTPFTLTSLRGTWGWTLFGLIWGLAIAGIVFKLYFTGRFKWTNRDKGEIVPIITGTAFVNAEATLLLEEKDPFCWGIRF